jgi:hypothetical protein
MCAEELRMRLSVFFVAGFALSLFACSSDSPGPSNSSNSGSSSTSAGSSTSSNSANSSGSAPTFTEVYAQLLGPQCAGCHTAGKSGVTGGKLDLSTQATAYTNLVNVAGMGEACNGQGMRVAPNNPAMSLLYEKIAGTPPCGVQMPLNGTPVSQTLVTLVHDWIAANAPNN